VALSRLSGDSSWSPSAHTRALCEALLVTALWSSSYVFIRVGLADIPALTFAGLRYGLATLVLLPVLVARGDHRTLGRATRRQWALLVGVAFQGLPHLSLANWGVVVWLALVNTAVAFVLWNRSLRTLSAVESSVVNNTMLVQVALLGWVALGEPLSATDWAALLVVGVGALVVQVRR
jgi:drug/metabolite transporter (DMT)-like permease